MVHGNVKRFLRSLDRLGVPYTYQIIQTSNIQLIENSAELFDKEHSFYNCFRDFIP